MTQTRQESQLAWCTGKAAAGLLSAPFLVLGLHFWAKWQAESNTPLQTPEPLLLSIHFSTEIQQNSLTRQRERVLGINQAPSVDL